MRLKDRNGGEIVLLSLFVDFSSQLSREPQGRRRSHFFSCQKLLITLFANLVHSNDWLHQTMFDTQTLNRILILGLLLSNFASVKHVEIFERPLSPTSHLLAKYIAIFSNAFSKIPKTSKIFKTLQ